jgi:iron complex outermembrane recepter protein
MFTGNGRRQQIWTYLTAAWLATHVVQDASAQTGATKLRGMSLEEVLNQPVTTVSRGEEPALRVPAAIHVITQDDIHRSGATSIPEVLRLAPGLQVARINAGIWAIGTRGFADRLARSMLVLIDGRPVYSPLFAGTYWETQDFLLDDIERIEVIRGPGGTLWGANAVNGIINIITKSAKNSAGLIARLATGSEDRALVGLRYGGTFGDWDYRVYGKVVNKASQFHADGLDFDGLRGVHGGIRADRTFAGGRMLTVHGDAYGIRLGQRETLTSYTAPFSEVSSVDSPLSGANILTRWNEPIGPQSSFQLQASYARTNRDERPVGEKRDTVDIDFQHTPAPWRAHQLVWGLGYRVTSGRIRATALSAFNPATRTDRLFSGFLQDEVSIDDRWRLTVGTKFEHNDYSGAELQPSARLLWSAHRDHTLWWSVTRAVRTPSRVETDYTTTSLLNPTTPLFVRLLPNPEFKPERLIAYETGYRVRPVGPLYVSLAGFYNRLEDVLSTEILPAVAEPPVSPVRVIVPVIFANGLEGESYGGEISADVRPAPWWRVTGNYSYVRIQLARLPGSLDGSQERRNEGLSPRHQVRLHTSLDLARRWSVDADVRHVSALPAAPLPSYTTADARLAVRLTPRLELAIVGQDLMKAHHVEWPSTGANIAIQRRAYINLTWQQ